MPTFQNPIIPGFNPDPSICRVGEDYYLVTSTFEFFPGVPVYHSRDLVNWSLIGHCLTRRSQLNVENCLASRGIWAPTLRHHEGVFYMITTVMNGGELRKFLVTATDPAGEWSEPVWIDQPGIDPSLLFDDDGKVYVTSNGSGPTREGIFQAEIDVRTGALLSENRVIWGGTGGAYPEAPHLYKIKGRYYLVIAEGGTAYGHMVTVARSDSPWGPFESCPRNPILTHRHRCDHIVQGTGHADLIQAADGSWWAVFLAFRISTQFFHHLGRETFLAPVSWSDDGWPMIGRDGRVELVMDSPGFAAPQKPSLPWSADFSATRLGLAWHYLRNPADGAVSLSARPGHLRLLGTATALHETGPLALVALRQTEWTMTFRTTLAFEPAAENEDAGLTAYYFNERHVAVAVSRRAGVRMVRAWFRLGEFSVPVGEHPCPAGLVTLAIHGDDKNFRLGYEAGGDFVELGRVPCSHLSVESAPIGFTGVMLALYASGNGTPSTAPADFASADYHATPSNSSPVIAHEV
jgi:alpha-N-arabinofuranosidase